MHFRKYMYCMYIICIFYICSMYVELEQNEAVSNKLYQRLSVLGTRWGIGYLEGA